MRKNHFVASMAMATAVGSATGCDVIVSSLRNDISKDASNDSGPHDAPIDMPLDAYAPYVGNLVTNPGMELGTTNWETNGGGMIALSTGEAHTGNNSLLLHERTGAWNGPAQNIFTKIRPLRQYTADVWVRLNSDVWSPGPDTFSLSIRFTCAEDGSTQQFNVNASRTPATAPDGTTWVQPTTMFMAPSSACTLVEFLVYVESTSTAGYCAVTTTTACTVTNNDCPGAGMNQENCYLSNFLIDDFEVLEAQ